VIWLVEITPKKQGNERKRVISRYAVIAETEAQATHDAAKAYGWNDWIETITVEPYDDGQTNVIALQSGWR
jgi:hypothetical protein